MQYPMLTTADKVSVTVSKHYKLYNYPDNWHTLPEYQDWRNNTAQLCCFCEVDNGSTKYLVTSVY